MSGDIFAWLGANVAGLVWIAIFIVMVVVEASTAQLVSIWFALGAVGAALAAFFGLGPVVQVLVFLAVSFLCLWLTRIFLKKTWKARASNTDIQENLVGSNGLVIEEVDVQSQKGRIRIGGVDWPASTSGDEVIEIGANVVVCAMRGNRCIVERDPLY